MRIIAIFTIIGFFILSLIAFNIVQPTMDFGLHCTIHDYVSAALGGECQTSTKSLVNFSGWIAIAAFFGILSILFLSRVNFLRIEEIARTSATHLLLRDRHKFFETPSWLGHIQNGRALTRRFV